jgi:hypothetical protein
MEPAVTAFTCIVHHDRHHVSELDSSFTASGKLCPPCSHTIHTRTEAANTCRFNACFSHLIAGVDTQFVASKLLYPLKPFMGQVREYAYQKRIASHR